MKILYGENTTQSRQQLVTYINQAKTAEQEIVRLEGKKLDRASLEEALGASSLFGNSRLVVIEELHSLPKSKKKDELITLIAQASGEEGNEIVLWESRALTATMLKQFPGAKNEEFKLSNTLFKWLESLSPDQKTKKNQLLYFYETLNTEDVFLCFTMVIRQVRLLIQAKDNAPIKGPPFMITKLKKQAQLFTMPQLLKVHHKLLEVDLAHKTSSHVLSLEQQLDLLLLEL